MDAVWQNMRTLSQTTHKILLRTWGAMMLILLPHKHGLSMQIRLMTLHRGKNVCWTEYKLTGKATMSHGSKFWNSLLISITTKLNTIWNITYTVQPLIYNDVQHSPPWGANTSTVIKLPVCYVVWSFIAMFTKDYCLTPSSARWIQSMSFASYFLKKYFNIISTPRSSMWPLLFRFNHKLYALLFVQCVVHAHPSHHPWFHGEENTSWSLS